MFDVENTIDLLQDFKRINPKKRRKVIKGLFYDEVFLEWLFQPKKVPNLNAQVTAMYTEFTKPIVMRAIIDAVKEEGYHEFTRTHSTFLFSVANIAIQGNNEMLEEVEKKKKSGEMSSKDARKILERVEDSNEVIAKLLKVSRKIIKRDATELARRSRLPRYVCITALHSVPEPQYVDRYKIGFYLNNLLNSIYSEVEENGEFENGVRWKEFFREIFGKDNVVEAATFILLEGVHRIDKYKNSDDVRECWDTLTSFALRELNSAPQNLRQQMIELYIKRIDKMFQNRSFDLRVDLLDISDRQFPDLVKTVEKYTDKIVSILSRGKKD